ncbi:MAG: hypothetical protein KA243_02025 [Candidatus Aminicenantes bacterium]|nr:hypothetical protein [Candidatus Aminicenantes bacterium]
MKAHDKAWVVTVLMGLGHLRAAHPLRDLTHEGVVIYGSRGSTPDPEYGIWRRLRRVYYASSKAGAIPLIGKTLVSLLLAVQRIAPYYPKSDQSKPTAAVRFLKRLVVRRGLCRSLREKLAAAPLPAVHTFYATAVAMDELARRESGPAEDQYLLICDADFNRVWVPEEPRTSCLRYLAPCTQVKRRLRAYGVPEEAVFMTGFPLPKENIGSESGLEVLKADLFDRLLRLDPCRKFFSFHERSVLGWLGRTSVPTAADLPFRVMFAIGGAGAQAELVGAILQGLRGRLLAGDVCLTLSCGIQKRVFERVQGALSDAGLRGEIGRTIDTVYDPDIHAYLEKFNARLRTTDVLWTKPSELAFYCGLGMPILMADPIGAQEELNKRWLREIHAGVSPPGPVEACGEWLFDLRENGRLAEAAWDGFLKARKLGTFKIERLIRTGEFREGATPLDQ